MKAPFPYFGGKSRIAATIWDRVGPCANYVEPFCGSCAMLLSAPRPAAVETVNDINGWVANFWRAVKADPDAVAEWADYPVSELDLHARGDWLFYGEDAPAFVERMRSDPEYYDPKRAGWWVWGQCAWIGDNWGQKGCRSIPALGDAGKGVNRQLPHLGDAGKGVNRQLPHLGDPGMGERSEYILTQMRGLAARLRNVRVACGEWTRVLGPSSTFRHGRTMVFLDPPYSSGEHGVDYDQAGDVWPAVTAWAAEAGQRPDMAVVLCGYDGTWDAPPGWQAMRWKASGGYGSQGDARGRENCKRETVWFSPGCNVFSLLASIADEQRESAADPALLFNSALRTPHSALHHEAAHV